jgi:hypothetical protein
MTPFRRPLASCALVVLLLQVAGVIAAPVSACCRSAHVTAPAACCKAVSHQSGPCPMHASSPRATSCRIACDSRTDAPLLAGFVAPLPSVPSVSAAIVSEQTVASAAPALVFRTSVPDSPPPKALRNAQVT